MVYAYSGMREKGDVVSMWYLVPVVGTSDAYINSPATASTGSRDVKPYMPTGLDTISSIGLQPCVALE